MKNAAGGKQEKLLGTPRKLPRAGELSAGRGSRAQVGSGHNQIPATPALATSVQSGSPHAETLTESQKTQSRGSSKRYLGDKGSGAASKHARLAIACWVCAGCAISLRILEKLVVYGGTWPPDCFSYR